MLNLLKIIDIFHAVNNYFLINLTDVLERIIEVLSFKKRPNLFKELFSKNWKSNLTATILIYIVSFLVKEEGNANFLQILNNAIHYILISFNKISFYNSITLKRSKLPPLISIIIQYN